jgi:hypothetical protein
MTNAAAQINDIRDIKPPIEIHSGWEWLWWTLGALALFVIASLVWRYVHKRMTRISIAPPIPAHVRAKQKLEEALALISQPKEFCVLVSDTIRFYLEERFDFRAPERTTEEFLRELGGTDLLAPEQKESLGKFLESCDLVKFAKYEPRENELRELHGAAVKLVEETEPTIEQQQAEIISQTITEPIRTSEPEIHISPKAKIFAVVGTFLQLAPIIWVIGYIVSLVRLYNLAVNAPTTVSSHGLNALTEIMSQELAIMKNELWLILISVLLGLVGLILLAVSLIPLRYRAEWFFWFLTIYGVILLGAFPFGTIFGIFFLVFCLTKQREFLNRS